MIISAMFFLAVENTFEFYGLKLVSFASSACEILALVLHDPGNTFTGHVVRVTGLLVPFHHPFIL
jgi:hypothetical protein